MRTPSFMLCQALAGWILLCPACALGGEVPGTDNGNRKETSQLPEEGKHDGFDRVFETWRQVELVTGAGAPWRSPAARELLHRSPKEIATWLSRRLDQLRGPKGPLSSAVLDAYGRAAVALREKDHLGKTSGKLCQERFRMLSTALSFAQRARTAPIGGMGLELLAFGKDYPDEKALYCVLMVHLFQTTSKTVIEFSGDYWTISHRGDTKGANKFRESIRKEAQAFLCGYMEKLYRANLDNDGQHLVAIHLAKCYSVYFPNAAPKALALVRKHRPVWEKNAGLRRIATREIHHLLGAKTLTWLTFVDTTGNKWTNASLKGKTSMLCFFWSGQTGAFDPGRKFAGGAISVIGFPLDKPVGLRRPFTVMADPTKTDIRRLKATFALGGKVLPYSVLITPTLDILWTREAIDAYMQKHFPPRNQKD